MKMKKGRKWESDRTKRRRGGNKEVLTRKEGGGGGRRRAREPFGLSADDGETDGGRREKNEQRNEEVQRQLRYSITSGISSASKLYAKCTRRPPPSRRVTAS